MMIGLFLAHFFGGAFFVNAIPHFVSGLLGQPFPTPFAQPPGKGNSSPVVNVVWGAVNFAVAYLLLCQYVLIDLRSAVEVGVAGLGGLLMGLMLARYFGQVRAR